MSKAISYTLAQLAEHIGATIIGDSSVVITKVATLNSAKTGQIAFLANSKYKKQLLTTDASAVILAPDCSEDYSGNALVMKNPYLGFALVAQLLDTTPSPAIGIHRTAVISDSAKIADNVSIGANAVIEDDVVLESGVVIGAGCFIGKSAYIGANTKLWANVSIYHHVILGNNCLIQSNSAIGSDGFGYANENGCWQKIPQLGTVVIGNNVEIGACTSIDRGALDNTEIHDGAIIDNQVQIAHNVIVGKHTAIAGSTGIAGSTTIGNYCTIGGGVAMSGHLTIADKTMITGNTMVIKSITKSGVYSSGMPAIPNRDWLKNNVRINKLEQLTNQVKKLQAQLDALQSD